MAYEVAFPRRPDRNQREQDMVVEWSRVSILVAEAQMGNREAFDELVVRFRACVMAKAMERVRNENDAEELCHEVFVHAWRKLHQLRDPRCLAAWLRQITVNLAINRMSRRWPPTGAQEVLDSVAGVEQAPTEALERDENREMLYAALGQLKPQDRDTLEAFYIREQSLKQMSLEFDAPVGTIKRRLFVARERLRAVLDDSNDEPANRQAGPKPRSPRPKRALACA